ncbi:MAG: hypothetical protein FWG85_02470 [Bacteroidetes bacterium]|nr:hypothetical protein [Bacteroidota bacterium]
MKKTFFLITIFMTTTNFCFSQNKSENILPNSKIGVLLGKHWCESGRGIHTDYHFGDGSYWEIPTGIGASIFYNYTLIRKAFVSFNLGYNSYARQTIKYSWGIPPPEPPLNGEVSIASHKEPSNIVATIGVNVWCYSDKIYFGLAGGALCNIAKNTWGLTETYPAFYLIFGGSIPIPKYNISIEANAKYAILLQSQINVGVAYLLP